MTVAVVDACVVAKWFLPDEADCPGAAKLREDFLEGKVALMAPPLLEHELTSLVWKAARDGRLSTVDAIDARACASEIGVMLSESPKSLGDSIALAIELRQSPYDCSYLALALRLGCDLYTADRRFWSAVMAKHPCVKDIDEYAGQA